MTQYCITFNGTNYGIFPTLQEARNSLARQLRKYHRGYIAYKTNRARGINKQYRDDLAKFINKERHTFDRLYLNHETFKFSEEYFKEMRVRNRKFAQELLADDMNKLARFRNLHQDYKLYKIEEYK